LLGFSVQAPWNLIAAEVVARELGPWSRTLLLDKGAAQGVAKGMAVITPVGLVGRISEVGGSSSRVRLITDAHFRVPGKVSQTHIAGLVKGGSTGECLLTYLPLDAEVNSGLVVLTAGGKSFSPGGIQVGVVRRVEPDASTLYLNARLEPSVNLHAIEEVLVVEWPQEQP